MSTPLVSIYCTTYNQEKYLRQCLDGIVMQKTDFTFQAIVHDDVSSDSTAEIIKEYAEEYPDIIIPLIETENQFSKVGELGLFHIMYPHLTGKYIAYCEGDDYWTDPNKLQKQVDFLESHSDYSMCFHRAKTICEIETKEKGPRCEDIESRDYDVMELFREWIVPTASMVMRREAIEYFMKLKDPKRMVNSDMFWVLCSGATGKIRGFDDFMSAYRIQASGITYDPIRIKKVKMLWPEHFMCVYDNFPNMSKRELGEIVARQLWLRYEIQDTLSQKIKDLKLCHHYDSHLFWLWVWRIMIKNRIKTIIKR